MAILIVSLVVINDTHNDGEIAINWGIKYEPIAVKIYEKLKKTKVNEIGLIEHPKIKWLGASPDGILNCGKLLEIKCVWKRRLKEKDVEPYIWIQIQIQLECCDLDVCDLFECKFIEYKTKRDYMNDKDSGIEHRGYDGGKYWKLDKYVCKD